MIFTLNIDENKREEFFKENIKENIDESIYNNYIAGKGFSIEQIFDLFAYLEKAYLELKDINNVAKIKASKENLYK
ncbi:MAG: hypothetical protein LBC61_03805 [Candidatus Peribacteria bacterium]|jgi:hypothetical protein|nr:hypothetical protein [Candidatus Peribacteria bacterium]